MSKKSELLELSEHLLNVDVEIFSHLKNYDLYEKYQKIGSGELTIDDFTDSEIDQLTKAFKDYASKTNQHKDMYDGNLIEDDD